MAKNLGNDFGKNPPIKFIHSYPDLHRSLNMAVTPVKTKKKVQQSEPFPGDAIGDEDQGPCWTTATACVTCMRGLKGGEIRFTSMNVAIKRL